MLVFRALELKIIETASEISSHPLALSCSWKKVVSGMKTKPETGRGGLKADSGKVFPDPCAPFDIPPESNAKVKNSRGRCFSLSFDLAIQIAYSQTC